MEKITDGLFKLKKIMNPVKYLGLCGKVNIEVS